MIELAAPLLVVRRGKRLAQSFAAQHVCADDLVDGAFELRLAALLARLDLSAQKGAFPPPERDQLLANRLLLALITEKPCGDISIACCRGKAYRIKRRLGDSGPDMRARYESSIAQKRDAPEHHPLWLQIKDRLEKRFAAQEARVRLP